MAKKIDKEALRSAAVFIDQCDQVATVTGVPIAVVTTVLMAYAKLLSPPDGN